MIWKFRKFVVLRFMEPVDSLSMWCIDVDVPWGRTGPPPEVAEASNRVPSSDPKSFSLRSDERIGVRDVPFGLDGCWRHMPSAVRRALLRSDEKMVFTWIGIEAKCWERHSICKIP